jgi:hypothetical protein
MGKRGKEVLRLGWSGKWRKKESFSLSIICESIRLSLFVTLNQIPPSSLCHGFRYDFGAGWQGGERKGWKENLNRITIHVFLYRNSEHWAHLTLEEWGISFAGEIFKSMQIDFWLNEIFLLNFISEEIFHTRPTRKGLKFRSCQFKQYSCMILLFRFLFPRI